MRHSTVKLAITPLLATLALTLSAAVAVAGSPAPTDAGTGRVPAHARSTSAGVVVYFTRGEHFAKVARPAADGASLDAALRALSAGPTSEELRVGLRSHIPAQAMLLGTSVTDGVATIDVSAEFTRGSRASLRARLAQVVYTVTRFADVRAVRLSVGGVAVAELGGLALEPPITRDAFEPVPSGGPPLQPLPGRRSTLVREVQERLILLGYLPAGAADGIAGPQTAHGILAFQGWEGLRRDGRATMALKGRLETAIRPVPARGPARRIDVSLRRQVALLIEPGRTVRAIHVSTGKPSSPTPPGRFTVFRKELRSWSVPFQVWLPYASYFNQGIAFHESPDVPAYPASAGCVRIPASDSALVYRFATLGTKVIVRRS